MQSRANHQKNTFLSATRGFARYAARKNIAPFLPAFSRSRLAHLTMKNKVDDCMPIGYLQLSGCIEWWMH
jgi:hypothetical protein